MPGATLEQYTSVKTGQPLLIERPDGSTLQATERGVEYPPAVKWVGTPPPIPRYGLLVDFIDIPVGSTVSKL